MAPKAPAETTQISKVELPKWVQKASKGNYGFAKRISKRPMPIYKDDRVAEQSGMTTDAYKYLMENVGAQDPLFENAAALQGRTIELDPRYEAAAGYAGNIGALDSEYADAARMAGRVMEQDPIYRKAQGILAETAGPWDIDPYLNPYTKEVEKRAIANANRSLTESLMEQSDRARRAGAFGGSAAGIERGVLAAEGARGIGDLSAELRRAGYDKATADLLADRASKQAAAGGMISGAESRSKGILDTASSMLAGTKAKGEGWLDAAANLIAGADAQGRGWREAAAGILDTAKSRGAQVATDVAGMLGAGAQEQAQRQKLIDANMAKFYEKRDKPLERLNIRLAALGMSPYGKTETTTKTGTSESQGPDFATIGLGILQMLPGLLSDRRDKKDIEKLGDDPDTGIPIYAYRYKKDRKGSPKSVGPMAQDIEKIAPHMVTEIGGHKVIKGMLAA